MCEDSDGDGSSPWRVERPSPARGHSGTEAGFLLCPWVLPGEG